MGRGRRSAAEGAGMFDEPDVLSQAFTPFAIFANMPKTLVFAAVLPLLYHILCKDV